MQANKKREKKTCVKALTQLKASVSIGLAKTQAKKTGGGKTMFDRTEFRVQVVRAQKSYKEIAEYLGIDESTLYRKIQNNGSFTREEIGKLIEFLDISDPKAIFFAD